EFVAHAKARPGKLNYSSSASTSMLAMEMFNKATGIEMLNVPYKGAAPSAVALATGEVQATMNHLTAYQSFVDAGKIRVLAIANDEHIASQPQIPTLAEAGVRNMRVVYTNGVWAPVGTPRAIIDRLNGA